MTPSDDNMDATAAEYVLGTLDAAGRLQVTSARTKNAALDAAIYAWERRLAPLADEVAAVAPPSGLFAEIEQRVSRDGNQLAVPSIDPVQTSATILTLERRVAGWRRVAIATSAIAAGLLIAVGVRETQRPSAVPQNFVAVFQKDDAQPAFVLSIDLVSRELTIRPVTADRQAADKTYQLWILADQLGPLPKSLGLLAGAVEPTRKRLDQFQPDLLQNATFGISVEPAGGSPTGRPTGPALHGRLIAATP